MNDYRSMLDSVLASAKARANTPLETAKTASAGNDGSPGLVKEAQQVAEALEFLSLSAAGGGATGAFRTEMVRSFFKEASGGNPANGPTMSSGTQGQAPSQGKATLTAKGLVGGNAPAQSSVSAATKDGEKPLRESFKQAEGASLFDVLMNNKTAASGGPAEYDAETSAGVTSANENAPVRAALSTNEGPVNAKRRDLRKSTRARLAEAFAHTGDTLSDATAAQIFPQAAARGSLKVAGASVKSRLSRLTGYSNA
jgi:hypothetical protein